jgi:iron(III) transport system permease protein
MTNYLDPNGAFVAATPLLVIALSAALLMAISERRVALVSHQPRAAGSLGWIAGRWAARLLLGTYFVAIVLLPMTALLVECRSPAHFLVAVRDAAPEARSTLTIALGATAVACAAAWAVAPRSSARLGRASEILAMLPIAVPALLVALAYSRFFNRSWPLDLAALGDTSVLVILGLGFRGWPFAARITSAGRRQFVGQWHEAAELANVSGLRRWRWITVPLQGDYFAAAAVIAFVVALGEVEISQMLCAPGYGTLSLRLFTFLHFGPAHVAASLAVLQMILAATPVFLYFLLSDRCLQVV